MPSLKLSNPFRRSAERPSLKERAAALKASAAKIMQRRPAIPEAEPAPSQDPVFALIQRHRAAYMAWVPHLNVIAGTPVSSPDFDAAEADGEPSRLKEGEAFADLLSAEPTTLDGLLALANYLPGAVARNGRDDPEDDGVMALTTVCDALHTLADRKAIVADDDPFDWNDAPAGFVAYPFEAPMSFSSISGIVIPNEAKRLLALAEQEFSRRLSSGAGWKPADQWRMELRQMLRLPELEALVGRAVVPADPFPSSDPVFAAITANRCAEADMQAFGERAAGRMSEAERAEENALWEAQNATRNAAFETVPTTAMGRRALVNFARFQAELFYGADWRNEAKHKDMVFGSIFLSLAAAIEAEPLGQAHSGHPDTALIALGEAFKSAQALWDEAMADCERCSTAYLAAPHEDHGVGDAERRCAEASDQVHALADKAALLPAVTAEGLRVKLRIASFYGAGRQAGDRSRILVASLMRDAGVTPADAEEDEG